jgi:glycine cleavage system H protein
LSNLEYNLDKFIFRVAVDRRYSPEGLWAREDGGRVTVGLSDFLQQRSGDIAFAEVAEPGAKLSAGDDLATIETVKVGITLASPVSGAVLEVNPALNMEPEVINRDPYDQGWLAVIAASDWPADRARLLDAQAYFDQMVAEANEETGR